MSIERYPAATHEAWSACPQEEFDFRQDSFGRSHAFHLRDPGGIILEIMRRHGPIALAGR
ncbi:MAG: hypothetical protein DBX43_00995 [Coriobacteriia bacterium]|nr:MAG: hypothetical protein DBX43_00995 [Coriobacteriia bacterium]